MTESYELSCQIAFFRLSTLECGRLSGSKIKHFNANDLTHSVKIGIVMKKEKVIFDSRLGNQAIDCATNRYPLFPAF